jgi:hypothetical protein
MRHKSYIHERRERRETFPFRPSPNISWLIFMVHFGRGRDSCINSHIFNFPSRQEQKKFFIVRLPQPNDKVFPAFPQSATEAAHMKTQ